MLPLSLKVYISESWRTASLNGIYILDNTSLQMFSLLL